MNRRIRQYLGIIAAVVVYYVVHEGAHLLTALYYGVFKNIQFMGIIGIQIDVYNTRMTDTQLGVLCIMGPVATFIAGYLLVFFGQIVGHALLIESGLCLVAEARDALHRRKNSLAVVLGNS